MLKGSQDEHKGAHESAHTPAALRVGFLCSVMKLCAGEEGTWRSCVSQGRLLLVRLGQEPGKEPGRRLFSCPAGLLCYTEGMDEFVAIIGNRICSFRSEGLGGLLQHQ